MLLPTKGVQHAKKKQSFRQHVVDNKKSYAAVLCQNAALPQPQDKTFTFPVEQLVKFVIAQPQVCYVYSCQDAIDKKSSIGVDMAGKNVWKDR